jgi:hypothetical protein
VRAGDGVADMHGLGGQGPLQQGRQDWIRRVRVLLCERYLYAVQRRRGRAAEKETC